MRLPGSHNTKNEVIEAHDGVAPLVKGSMSKPGRSGVAPGAGGG
jgi:hypothetical protein